MTRTEILKTAKPILFNTEMVRAILNNEKSVTRRILKPQPYKESKLLTNNLFPETVEAGAGNVYAFSDGTVTTPTYKVGDILYVRETWCKYSCLEDDLASLIADTEKYYYRADGENPTPFNRFLVQKKGYDEYSDYPLWRPSIHMPKEAARIFLRVTNVRVERLQDITKDEIIDEYLDYEEWATAVAPPGSRMITLRDYFSELWNSTVKKSDLDKYGWAVNPWVWVIEFERVEVTGGT